MKHIPINLPQRRDRAVEDEAWIASMLHRAAFTSLATVADGQPYITTLHYVFDEDAGVIYVHGAPTGHMRSSIELNPRVCVSIAEIGRLLPAPDAFGMGGEYASVVVFGRASAVTDDAEARRALEMLLAKYFGHLEYGTDYGAIRPDELARTAVFRIEIDAWSGRQKQAAADFPGAFWFGRAAADERG